MHIWSLFLDKAETPPNFSLFWDNDTAVTDNAVEVSLSLSKHVISIYFDHIDFDYIKDSQHSEFKFDLNVLL